MPFCLEIISRTASIIIIDFYSLLLASRSSSSLPVLLCRSCAKSYTSFFNSGPKKYTVRLYDKEKGEQHTDTLNGVTILDRSQIFYSSSGRTRSISPKKGKAPSANQENKFIERGRARYRSPNYYKPQRESQQNGHDHERSKPTLNSLSFIFTVSSSYSLPETHILDKENEWVAPGSYKNRSEANNEEIDLAVTHMLEQKQHFIADAPSIKRQRVR
ncbi:hypothetical protein HD806DRAFT_420657 [Xylariaceae sp. AK1471]|nr:hypothetical protein HD806DRAFT_420657 [Xylariaceae sp. AK1471]